MGISELVNGPKSGKAAKSLSTTCVKKGRRPKSIADIGTYGRTRIQEGAEICIEETQKFVMDGKDIKIEKTYIDSSWVYDIFKMKIVWSGQSVEVAGEGLPRVLTLSDLGDDGSLEMIFTYYSIKGEDPGGYHNRIRLIKIDNGKVTPLYDGKDTGAY